MLTAPALVPVGAHLFELPNKIGLSEEHYFLVQSIYRGWALFGIVIFAAILTNLLAAALLWREARAFWPNLAAGLISGGDAARLFRLDLPGQCRDQQLDGGDCGLGELARPMGAITRHKRDPDFCRAVLRCPVGAYQQTSLSGTGHLAVFSSPFPGCAGIERIRHPRATGAASSQGS
jgi:hypothetical protein